MRGYYNALPKTAAVASEVKYDLYRDLVGLWAELVV
jgi:hypothetical protein